MINKIMALLNLDESNEQHIHMLVDKACYDFCAYCGREDVPAAAEYIIIQMVLFSFNTEGREGLKSQSFSGVSETYSDDNGAGYPSTLTNLMNRFRKVKFV